LLSATTNASEVSALPDLFVSAGCGQRFQPAAFMSGQVNPLLINYCLFTRRYSIRIARRFISANFVNDITHPTGDRV
jgi:hypothetical protein